MKEKTDKDYAIFKDNNKKDVDFILNSINNKIVPIEVGMRNKKLKQVKHAIKTDYDILISNRTKTITKEENVINIPLSKFSFM